MYCFGLEPLLTGSQVHNAFNVATKPEYCNRKFTVLSFPDVKESKNHFTN